jgi:hypothetical protein
MMTEKVIDLVYKECANLPKVIFRLIGYIWEKWDVLITVLIRNLSASRKFNLSASYLDFSCWPEKELRLLVSLGPT